jgi:hypothetical protein
VVDRETGSRQSTAQDRQKIDQEGGRVGYEGGRPSPGDAFRPAGGGCLEQGGVDAAVISGHRQGQPTLQLAQGEHGHAVGIVGAPLSGIGKGGPGQLVHPLHRGADDALDDAAEMGSARRTIGQRDAVLLAAAA